MNDIQRTVLQRIDDARQLLHFLLIDESVTTAQTLLVETDFADPLHVEIWRELVAMDDAVLGRDIASLARRLRRRGIEPGRELRCILATDTGVCRAHWQWVAAEIKRHAGVNEKYRAALEELDRLRA